MPRYAITETAGRFVAGQTNTGVGSVMELTEKQAEHEVRLGSLRGLDVKPAAKATKSEKAAAKSDAPEAKE